MDHPAPSELLAPLLALAAAAGINLYATGFIAGGLAHLHWVSIPDGLHWLSHPAVMVVFFILFWMEFLADKIRFVDTLWDMLHTVIRPAGAIVFAFGLSRSLPEWTVPLLLLAGTTAFATHAAKASVSLGLKAAPPVGLNTARSLAEDALAMSLTWLAFAHPWLSVALVALIFLAMALLAPRLGALARFWLLGPFTALKAALDRAPVEARIYDEPLNKLFGGALPPLASLRFIHPAFLVRGPGLGFWRRAHLAADRESLFVVRAGFVGLKAVRLPFALLHHVRLTSGLLYDTLELNSAQGRGRLLLHATATPALRAALEAFRPPGGVWELRPAKDGVEAAEAAA